MALKTIMNSQELKLMKTEVTRFMMAYKFALDEVNTKIDILKQEFQYIHEYNPIEHVESRLKSFESILEKISRKNYELSLPSIKENIRDIAGIRITCSFISDIYQISEMLQNQKDIQTLTVKDYIHSPKPNGYQSLHLVLQVPVFMSDREEHVCIEVQIRTIAMDFWASLEHKIFYKYNRAVPEKLLLELKDAAVTAAQLDQKMERLHKEMNKLKASANEEESSIEWFIENERLSVPLGLLASLPNL
ncbi:GTP pyrophosphokinase family protein [Planomicrobium sp. CPCC 101079]|uniref:GTP pyrophosphokinase n=1 Tax=Planomicrobium sp. CPCC 101079 TaxID=2599618 RepID=UPI0011B85C00|nr:GTP pyrophosphokinase family protein [Planomicrobium sp. CPCC 101079]TWT14590.1 GTP pyrophosphokinase family protein [Planomicrobium sp. CPCC 101079]